MANITKLGFSAEDIGLTIDGNPPSLWTINRGEVREIVRKLSAFSNCVSCVAMYLTMYCAIYFALFYIIEYSVVKVYGLRYPCFSISYIYVLPYLYVPPP